MVSWRRLLISQLGAIPVVGRGGRDVLAEEPLGLARPPDELPHVAVGPALEVAGLAGDAGADRGHLRVGGRVEELSPRHGVAAHRAGGAHADEAVGLDVAWPPWATTTEMLLPMAL